MKMIPVENKILTQIESLEKGLLIGPDDFSELGSSEAAGRSLLKLEKVGIITRWAQGIYSHERNLCLFRNFPKFKVLKILNE